MKRMPGLWHTVAYRTEEATKHTRHPVVGTEAEEEACCQDCRHNGGPAGCVESWARMDRPCGGAGAGGDADPGALARRAGVSAVWRARLPVLPIAD
jgi:hypothetical protein